MGLLVIAVFVLLPFLELVLIVAAADSVGLGATFAALVVFSVAGAWLMRREGWAVWRRANLELSEGRIPARQLVDGAMILGGGALLLTPGFLTDFVGLMLLLAPVRALLAPLALRTMAKRAAASAASARVTGLWASGPRAGFGGFDPTIVDVDAVDVDAEGTGRSPGSARVISVEPFDPQVSGTDDGPDVLGPGS